MSDKEEATSSGVETYRQRLRAKNSVDYSYKKRKMQYVNPFATIIQEKKSKALHARTTSKASNKRKMNFINPFALNIKKKKVDAHQSRSRINSVGSHNERRKSVEHIIAVKKQEDSSYNFRRRKIVNYSLIKRREKFGDQFSKPFETEQETSISIKLESNVEDEKYSSEHDDLSVSKIKREQPNSTITDSTCRGDDTRPLKTVVVHSTPLVNNKTDRAQNEVLQAEELSHDLNQIPFSIIKVKTEQSENDNKPVSKPLANQDPSDNHDDIPVDDSSDLDVQFIPKPFQIVTIDDDNDDDDDDKEEVKKTVVDESSYPVVINSDANRKSEIKINPFEMSQEVHNSENSGSHPEKKDRLDERIDLLLETASITDQPETLFRDRNTLEEPNFNILNANYVRRCIWELENKYRQYEVYSCHGVANEVGGIEQLTEEQLEHPYYKDYRPEPQLSEEEKERIELEKDRICEEASGFNNHLWRRPLNGGPFAQTNNKPIPKCPEFIHAFTPAGQHVAMKTDADRPPKFRTDWDRRLWDFATIFNFNRYREDIEEGFYLPENVDAEMENRIMKHVEVAKLYFREKRIELMPFEKMLLLNELKLLCWDKCIKTCLPHLEELAVSLLDDILNNPVYVFTLIKYVFIFITIKKVMLQKRYPALRTKATLLYEKIKRNAILKEGETLEEHIIPRAKLLMNHYQNVCKFDMLRLNARTATQSILKKLEGKEEDGNKFGQVDRRQNEEDNLLRPRAEDDSTTDNDDVDEISDVSDDSHDFLVNDSDEYYEDDDDDEEEDDDANINEESGPYDEVDNDATDSDHEFSIMDSSSSSEDEVILDSYIREE